MRYFDKTFFKFLFGFLCLLSAGLFFLAHAHAQVISEVMYDSPGADDDWVEIYNNGNASVSIVTGSGSGSWRFVDTSSHVLTLVSGASPLTPGSYAIITNDTAKFMTDWPSFSGALYKSSFSLTNTSNTIALKAAGGALVDQVSYSSAQGANGDGNSLSKQDDGSFIPATPTPGAVNAVTAIVVPVEDTTTNDATNNSTTTSDTNTNTNTTNTTSTVSENTSSHFSFTPITTAAPAPSFKLGAGRDRLGTIGTPMEFKAITNLDSASQAIFSWSFGDGSLGYGEQITHAYDYPGDYVVVLNATSPLGRATSRVNVKVVPDALAVVGASPERIEVSNSGKSEINLYGRMLVANGQNFVFPPDTIIKAGQTIAFSNRVTQLSPLSQNQVSLALAKPLAGLVTNAASAKPTLAQPHPDLSIEKINEIAGQLSLLENDINKKIAEQHVSLSPPEPKMASLESTTSVASVSAAAPGLLIKLKHFFGFR